MSVDWTNFDICAHCGMSSADNRWHWDTCPMARDGERQIVPGDTPTGPGQIRVVSPGDMGAAWMDSGKILVSRTPDPWAGAREHAAIVRELAEHGPFYRANDYGEALCAFCEGTDYPGHMLTDLANHEPTCLWRRARALYPDADAYTR